LRQIIEVIRQAPVQRTADPIAERVSDYIKAHLSEEITVSQIAEKMHISVYYLSHVFKDTTGTTIIEYRNELRLTRSKQLLIETDLSISEIAQDVGFGTASYFTEIFSRSEKISPVKYRTLHAKEAR
jgi:AraC-like DNA-binding protein